ncbi:MAG: serine hydrolase [Kordiimonadaceae bacterium]|nr:serine hydrolase [Kordiimonadaceae bacterium]
MIRNLLVATMIVATLGAGLAAKPLDTSAIKAALETRIKNGNGVGYVVGIIDGAESKIITHGQARKTSSNAPTKDSLFEIGSITKTFTGLLLADMVLKGEVSLDDTVVSLLPEGVRIPSYKGKEITLLDLATHTSALPRLPSNFVPKDDSNPYAGYTVEILYAFLASYELTREIGEKVEYSNLGMGLLGHALANKANMSYEDLLRIRIFEPLGMTNSTITLREKDTKNLIDPHGPNREITSHWDLAVMAGAGAIHSSAVDMMTYMAANLGLKTSRLDDAIEFSHKFRHQYGDSGGGVGLAWVRSVKTDNGVTFAHDGGTGGFRAFISFNKEQAKGVFVLANSHDNATLIGQALFSGDIANFTRTERKVVDVPATVLARYEGEYELAPNFSIVVVEHEGSLFSQATDQANFQLFSSAKNKFFAKQVEISFTFDEGSEGEIVSLIMHQNGRDTPGLKLSAKEQKANAEKRTEGTVSLTPDQVAQVVGVYRFSPRVRVTIAERAGSFSAQLTGQGPVPIFPKSSTKFFAKVVKASLTFNVDKQGAIVSVTLDQNGAASQAKKIT